MLKINYRCFALSLSLWLSVKSNLLLVRRQNQSAATQAALLLAESSFSPFSGKTLSAASRKTRSRLVHECYF